MSETDPQLNFDLKKRLTAKQFFKLGLRKVRRPLRELSQGVSPARFLRWTKEERRRTVLVRKWAIVLVLLVIAAIATPKAVQLGKMWRARRIATQALASISTQDWVTADHKLREAILLHPGEPRIALAAARLMSRNGDPAEAAVWWQTVAASSLLTASDHRDYAAMALAISDLDTASQQINLLMQNSPSPMPEDLLLAGQLAYARGLSDSALRCAEKVLNNTRATSEQVVAASRLAFQVETLDSSAREQACDRLSTLARDDSDPAAIAALALLARQPVTMRPLVSVFTPPAVQFCNGAITLSEIADRLDRHSNSRGTHRVLAFEIRARLEPSRVDELIRQAIDSLSPDDDETLVALGGWLLKQGRFDQLLKVVPLKRANNKKELFIQRVDALLSLNRLSQAETLLLSESSVIDPVSQHVYLAVVKSRAGETTASRNEWDRALDSAITTQQLLMLADYAQQNGAMNIADSAYDRAVIKQSGLRLAYVAHLRLAEAMDDTAKAHAIAAQITQLWPNDATSEMHELYLRLLLDPSSDNAQEAEKSAEALLTQNPWHPGAKMVLALARLKLGRNADALDAISHEGGSNSGVIAPLAVRVAALTANGWKDKAAIEAQKLAAVKLLPEERALISSPSSNN
jgi:Tfp pilus assembly protein PilF